MIKADQVTQYVKGILEKSKFSPRKDYAGEKDGNTGYIFGSAVPSIIVSPRIYLQMTVIAVGDAHDSWLDKHMVFQGWVERRAREPDRSNAGCQGGHKHDHASHPSPLHA